MDPGVYPDMPFAEYLALPAWGSGSLYAMRRGPPARVLWEQEHEHDDTDATLLGRLVHCMLLTPDLLEAEFVCKPRDMSFASKDGKAWRDQQTATIIPYDTWQTARNIVDAILAKEPACRSIENATHREATILWTCPRSGEACKGRPDWIAGRHLYDLKVSRYADSPALSVRAYYAGWMHQLAHYRTGAQTEGLDVYGGRLVVVSPAPPHFVHTLEVKTDSLDLIELENIATLQALRECRVSGYWPGTPDSWRKIEPPAGKAEAFEGVVFGPAEGESLEGSAIDG